MQAITRARGTRRQLIAGIAGALACRRAWAQGDVASFPNRAIRLVLPLPPGSMTDTLSRALAPELQRELGQPIIAENRPGGGGLIAFQAVKVARPDGYTIGIFSPSTWRDPPEVRLPYDPLHDFTYICNLSETAFAVAVAADSPFRNWRDLIDFGKAQPDRVSFGAAPGLGQSPHFFIEEVSRREGVRWLPVPFRGANEAVTALLSGQITFSVDPLLSTSELVRSGRLRYLAMARAEPVKNWPDVPTMRQLGYEIVIDSPVGVGGPSGIAPSVVARLVAAFRTALDSPAVIDVLDRADQPRRFLEPGPYRQLVEQSIAEQRDLAARYGIGSRLQ